MSTVEILWINKLDYPKDWGIRGHSHDFRQLFYITDGEGCIQIGSQDFHFQKNCCILMKPYEFHRLYRTKKGCVRMFDCKFLVHSDFLSQELDKLPPCIPPNSDEALFLIAKVREEWKHSLKPLAEKAPPYGKEIAGVLLEQLLYTLLREQATHVDEIYSPGLLVLFQQFPGISGEIAAYLADHYNCEFSLEDLAKQFNYNKNYLCKVFKITTQYTIKNYVTLLRIRRATDLICNTTKKLSEISDEVGFKDIHHFNRVYKKIMGQTPGDVRHQEKEGMFSDIVAHGEFFYRYYSKSEQGESYGE